VGPEAGEGEAEDRQDDKGDPGVTHQPLARRPGRDRDGGPRSAPRSRWIGGIEARDRAGGTGGRQSVGDAGRRSSLGTGARARSTPDQATKDIHPDRAIDDVPSTGQRRLVRLRRPGRVRRPRAACPGIVGGDRRDDQADDHGSHDDDDDEFHVQGIPESTRSAIAFR
jgi:hypothetical protein